MKGAVLRARAVPHISHRVRAAPFAKVQAVHAQRSAAARGEERRRGEGQRRRGPRHAEARALLDAAACVRVDRFTSGCQTARRWRGGDHHSRAAVEAPRAT